MNWRQNKSKIFAGLVIAAIMIGLILRLSVGTLFFWNKTDSAPHGLYVRLLQAPLEKSDYVIVRLPVDVPTLGVQEGFLLLKAVAGLSGDSYTVEKDALIFHGRRYPIYRTDDLPQLPTGTYQVPEAAYLLLNAPDSSFDSRYLGPMAADRIVCRVGLLLRTDGWW